MTPQVSTRPLSTKLNPWPIAIIAYFILFIGGVITFSIYAARQRVDLVRPDYYIEEIQFQQQLDRLNRTQPISAQVTIAYNPGQQSITVALPAAHTHHPTSGRIHLYRPSDAHLDQDLELAVNPEGVQHLDARKLQPGLWKVRVQWTVDGHEYFFAQSVVIEL
jgi:nitrogen fixation protein FixH